LISFWSITSVALAVAWAWRAIEAAIGSHNVKNIALPEWDTMPHICPPLADVGSDAPHLSIIVPARNEQQHIEAAMRTLLALEYPSYEIIAVDDRSTDNTGAILDALVTETRGAPSLRSKGGDVGFKVVHVTDLPPRWLGKTHAMWTAAQQAKGEWLLFTDADIMFRPDSLRRAIAYAEATNADHLVLFPRVLMSSWSARMMYMFFSLMFAFGHRPWKVHDPRAKDSIGVGAFNMVRRSVYEAVGGFEPLRMEIVEDMKLGELIKTNGYRQRCAFGPGLVSFVWEQSALGVIRNFTKNFFAVLKYSWWRALGAAFLLAFLNLLPFIGLWLTHGLPRAGFAVAVACIAGFYVGMSIREKISPLYFFLHPVSTVLFMYAVLRSMAVTLWRGGVEWRGTTYSLEELRNNGAI
jgi:glycosyltransferase involved in cell wall biosynthesis